MGQCWYERRSNNGYESSEIAFNVRRPLANCVLCMRVVHVKFCWYSKFDVKCKQSFPSFVFILATTLTYTHTRTSAHQPQQWRIATYAPTTTEFSEMPTINMCDVSMWIMHTVWEQITITQKHIHRHTEAHDVKYIWLWLYTIQDTFISSNMWYKNKMLSFRVLTCFKLKILMNSLEHFVSVIHFCKNNKTINAKPNGTQTHTRRLLRMHLQFDYVISFFWPFRFRKNEKLTTMLIQIEN